MVQVPVEVVLVAEQAQDQVPDQEELGLGLVVQLLLVLVADQVQVEQVAEHRQDLVAVQVQVEQVADQDQVEVVADHRQDQVVVQVQVAEHHQVVQVQAQVVEPALHKNKSYVFNTMIQWFTKSQKDDILSDIILFL